MKLTVLGSGTSVPHPDRSAPGFWLETDSGNILIDIGPDSPHRMAEEQLAWPNVDSIWVSHFHLDHFGGLAPFLFSLKWAPQTQSRTKKLRVVGPHGLVKLFEDIDAANNYRLREQRFALEIFEVAPGEQFQILPAIDATTMKTPHTIESLALILRASYGKTIVYTSDTGFSEELTRFAKNADLLVVECSFRRNKPVQSHLELVEVIQLAKQCQAKRTLLTHFYPEWDGTNPVLEAKQLWQADIVEATDGLVLTI